MSVRALLSVWALLMLFTAATVLVTQINLGSLNLVIAMVIATVKGSLVCLYFMHLRHDKPFHAIAFLTALLFAILFVGLTLMDQSQYLHSIAWDPSAAPDL